MRGKLNLLLMTLLISLSFVSGSLDSLGTGFPNETFRVRQVCNDATFINLSSITFPNSSIAVQNINMTLAGSGEFFYLFTNTSTIGRYDFTGISDGCDKTFATFFNIQRTGTELETSESLILIFLSISIFIFFCISLFFTLILPYSNRINTQGEPPQIVKLKYVKLGLILISYVLFVWFLNVLIGLSDSFVSLRLFFGFVSFLFTILNNLALPLGIIILVWMGIEIVRDSNVTRELKKFGNN